MDVQEARLLHIKSIFKLVNFREYESTKFIDTDEHYIEECLQIKSFKEQIYDNPLAKDISKRMKLSDKYAGGWFIGDVMHTLVYQIVWGDYSREYVDLELEKLYAEFLWIKRQKEILDRINKEEKPAYHPPKGKYDELYFKGVDILNQQDEFEILEE